MSELQVVTLGIIIASTAMVLCVLLGIPRPRRRKPVLPSMQEMQIGAERESRVIGQEVDRLIAHNIGGAARYEFSPTTGALRTWLCKDFAGEWYLAHRKTDADDARGEGRACVEITDGLAELVVRQEVDNAMGS